MAHKHVWVCDQCGNEAQGGCPRSDERLGIQDFNPPDGWAMLRLSAGGLRWQLMALCSPACVRDYGAKAVG